MISEDYEKKAIRAVQDLIIHTRNLAYQNQPIHTIAELLDGIEYLPALMLENEDRTELFGQFLEEICRKYDFLEVFERYK